MPSRKNSTKNINQPIFFQDFPIGPTPCLNNDIVLLPYRLAVYRETTAGWFRGCVPQRRYQCADQPRVGIRRPIAERHVFVGWRMGQWGQVCRASRLRQCWYGATTYINYKTQVYMCAAIIAESIILFPTLRCQWQSCQIYKSMHLGFVGPMSYWFGKCRA